MEWIGVAEAARELGVGEPHVRRLAGNGQLPARRIPAGWLISEEAVRRRPSAAPSAGRPLSPPMVWAVLHLLNASLGGDSLSPGLRARIPALADRRVRHRLRELLSDAPDSSRWSGWLRRRADPMRLWVHPGVLDRCAADPRLHPGGAAAAAAAGVGIAAGPPHRFYVEARHVGAVLADYRARADVSGNLELLVIPEDVPPELRPGPGPVPLAVALADLGESTDARERHLAASLSAAAPQAARLAVLL